MIRWRAVFRRVEMVVIGTLMAASILAMLLQLAGCSPTADDDSGRNLIAETHLAWSKLDDGSSFARTPGDPDGSATALRCWQAGTAGFDCLRATKYNGVSLPMTVVMKEHFDALPDLSLPTTGAGDGYSCQSLLNVTEQVERDGDTLISNQPSDLGDIWSRHHVDSYMTANHVSGVKWFPCIRVLNTVLRGSLSTLGTTSINKSDLGRGNTKT